MNLLSEHYNIGNLVNTTILTDYAVDSRYPSDLGEEPTEEDYLEALELAENVYSWVREKIGDII